MVRTKNVVQDRNCIKLKRERKREKRREIDIKLVIVCIVQRDRSKRTESCKIYAIEVLNLQKDRKMYMYHKAFCNFIAVLSRLNSKEN